MRPRSLLTEKIAWALVHDLDVCQFGCSEVLFPPLSLLIISMVAGNPTYILDQSLSRTFLFYKNWSLQIKLQTLGQRVK